MKTSVLQTGPAHFSQVGQRVSRLLHQTPERISPGLAERLCRHAERRLSEAGFTQAVGWQVEVYTLNADDKPADRAYTVRFQNDKGGYVELIGILTARGWPNVDHGFAIGHED